jgi:hypothetical protein
MRLSLAPRTVESRTSSIALIGLHALGRRYQRGFANDDAAIMADFLTLAMNYGKLRMMQKFFLPVGGGSWAGRATWIPSSDADATPLHVRTYLHGSEDHQNMPCEIAEDAA